MSFFPVQLQESLHLFLTLLSKTIKRLCYHPLDYKRAVFVAFVPFQSRTDSALNRGWSSGIRSCGCSWEAFQTLGTVKKSENIFFSGYNCALTGSVWFSFVLAETQYCMCSVYLSKDKISNIHASVMINIKFHLWLQLLEFHVSGF